MLLEKFCIVGLGNHAVTKIIPALEIKKKIILGIVSRKKQIKYKNYMHFKNINDAIKSLPTDTIFIIASPPLIHNEQIKKLVSQNRNIFVEKPLLTSSKHVKELIQSISNKNIIVVETLMYKHTELYLKFLEIFNKNKNRIKKININFKIPNYPDNTFRDEESIFSSCLYDIGCYAISLIVDMKIDYSDIELFEIVYEKKIIKSLNFSFNSLNYIVECSIGLDKEYQNYVKLDFHNDESIIFKPFFYGRKSYKQIIKKQNNLVKKEEVIHDEDAYIKLFGENYIKWMDNQKNRFENLLKVNQILEKISKLIIDKNIN